MLPSAANEYVYGEDGQVVRCPWHGYEFSIRTGESIAGTVRGRIPVFEIEVRDNAVFASLRRKQHHSKKTRLAARRSIDSHACVRGPAGVHRV
jgi:hypothetical protein